MDLISDLCLILVFTGSFSLEMSTPFKLTEDMIEVMGGLASPHFSEFVTLFCCGFLALQAHADTFLTIVEITCQGSSFKCFDGRDPDEIVGSVSASLLVKKVSCLQHKLTLFLSCFAL